MHVDLRVSKEIWAKQMFKYIKIIICHDIVEYISEWKVILALEKYAQKFKIEEMRKNYFNQTKKAFYKVQQLSYF